MGTLCKVWLSDHDAVYLNLIQNGIECKLWLKYKIRKEKTSIQVSNLSYFSLPSCDGVFNKPVGGTTRQIW